MSVCEKHGYDLRYIKECTGCVREERDRLRELTKGDECEISTLRNAVNNIRDERDRLREERDNALAAIEVWQREYQSAEAEVMRLRDLIPQAWEAAQKRMTPNRSLTGAPPATFREWMEQKGLL